MFAKEVGLISLAILVTLGLWKLFNRNDNDSPTPVTTTTATPSLINEGLPLQPKNFKKLELTSTTVTLGCEQDNTNNLHHYEIEFKEEGSETWIPANANVDKHLNNYTISELMPNKPYTFRIKSVNEGSKSLEHVSSEVITTPPIQLDLAMTRLPLQPKNFKKFELTSTTATLSWEQENTNNLDHYEIEFKEEGSETWISANKNVAKHLNKYTISDLEPNKKYTFRIKSVNEASTSLDPAFSEVINTPPITLDLAMTKNEVSKYMDTNTKPCEDFYKFACGNYNKIIPESKTQIDNIQLIEEKIKKEMLSFLNKESLATDAKHVKLVKSFFQSCKAEVRKESLNSASELLKTIRKWPIEASSFKENEYVLENLISDVKEKTGLLVGFFSVKLMPYEDKLGKIIHIEPQSKHLRCTPSYKN